MATSFERDHGGSKMLGKFWTKGLMFLFFMSLLVGNSRAVHAEETKYDGNVNLRGMGRVDLKGEVAANKVPGVLAGMVIKSFVEKMNMVKVKVPATDDAIAISDAHPNKDSNDADHLKVLAAAEEDNNKNDGQVRKRCLIAAVGTTSRTITHVVCWLHLLLHETFYFFLAASPMLHMFYVCHKGTKQLELVPPNNVNIDADNKQTYSNADHKAVQSGLRSKELNVAEEEEDICDPYVPNVVNLAGVGLDVLGGGIPWGTIIANVVGAVIAISCQDNLPGIITAEEMRQIARSEISEFVIGTAKDKLERVETDLEGLSTDSTATSLSEHDVYAMRNAISRCGEIIDEVNNLRTMHAAPYMATCAAIQITQHSILYVNFDNDPYQHDDMITDAQLAMDRINDWRQDYLPDTEFVMAAHAEIIDQSSTNVCGGFPNPYDWCRCRKIHYIKRPDESFTSDRTVVAREEFDFHPDDHYHCRSQDNLGINAFAREEWRKKFEDSFNLGLKPTYHDLYKITNSPGIQPEQLAWPDQTVLRVECDVGDTTQATTGTITLKVEGWDRRGEPKTAEFHQEGALCDPLTKSQNNQILARSYNYFGPIDLHRVGKFTLSISNGDAWFVDYLQLYSFANGGVVLSQSGADNTLGWCLSTDPSDGNNDNAYQSKCCESISSYPGQNWRQSMGNFAYDC